MVQMAPPAVDVIDGALLPVRFVPHDRDTKFCTSFRAMLQSRGVQPILLPPRSPNLNAFAERWVRSIKNESLSKLILFGEGSLRCAITEMVRMAAVMNQRRNELTSTKLTISRETDSTRMRYTAEP